jgi:hypothetical protein
MIACSVRGCASGSPETAAHAASACPQGWWRSPSPAGSAADPAGSRRMQSPRPAVPSVSSRRFLPLDAPRRACVTTRHPVERAATDPGSVLSWIGASASRRVRRYLPANSMFMLDTSGRGPRQARPLTGDRCSDRAQRPLDAGAIDATWVTARNC